METPGRCGLRVFDSAHVRGKRQAIVFTQQDNVLRMLHSCSNFSGSQRDDGLLFASHVSSSSLIAPIGRCDLQNLREGRQRVTRDRDPEFIVATANGITEALQRFHRHQGYAGIRFVPQAARTSSACQPLNSLLERKAS